MNEICMNVHWYNNRTTCRLFGSRDVLTYRSAPITGVSRSIVRHVAQNSSTYAWEMWKWLTFFVYYRLFDLKIIHSFFRCIKLTISLAVLYAFVYVSYFFYARHDWALGKKNFRDFHRPGANRAISTLNRHCQNTEGYLPGLNVKYTFLYRSDTPEPVDTAFTLHCITSY